MEGVFGKKTLQVSKILYKPALIKGDGPISHENFSY